MTDPESSTAQESSVTTRFKRRGLIAGAAALAVTAVAQYATQPVAALDGTPLLIGVIGNLLSPVTNVSFSQTALLGGPPFLGDTLIRFDARGTAGNTFGVFGFGGGTSPGIFGQSSGGYGVLGYSTAPSFAGLTGITTVNGVPAFAGGSNNPAAEAARFNGNVTIDCTGAGASSGFVVMPMSAKHGTVTHTDGTMRLMCSVEAPESWATDFGKAKLVGGKASVTLDPDFAAVIDASTMLVFPVPEGDSKGLYVTNKTATGFEVREQGGGTSNLTFAWKVVAHPKGQKVERLAKFNPHPVTLPAAASLPKIDVPQKP